MCFFLPPLGAHGRADPFFIGRGTQFHRAVGLYAEILFQSHLIGEAEDTVASTLRDNPADRFFGM